MKASEKVLVLGVFAWLFVITFRSFAQPAPVHAQTEASCGFYFEPGTTMIRTPANDWQVLGKVLVNTCNGQIWGFPTITNVPDPVDATSAKPPVLHQFTSEGTTWKRCRSDQSLSFRGRFSSSASSIGWRSFHLRIPIAIRNPNGILSTSSPSR